jgi:hypothetical protein
MAPQMSAHERYERGQMLKQIKMYDRALDDFRHAARDPQYAGNAHAQLALCFRAMGRHEDAAAAFRQALTAPTFSSEETVHLLYLLGQTLESLGRYAEALEAYGWVRQEDAGFRDVEDRIKHLCAGERGPVSPSLLVRQFRVGDVLKLCGHLRRRSLSLLEQTRHALSQSTGKDRPGQSARREFTPPRRSSPLVPSGRPVMARRSQMVKRQHARVTIQGRSQFSSKNQRITGIGKLRDLSPGGCRVTSSMVVPVGAELLCWIFPQNEVHPFTIEGATVRWSHAEEFGLAFTNIQPGVERQIAQLCAQPM